MWECKLYIGKLRENIIYNSEIFAAYLEVIDVYNSSLRTHSPMRKCLGAVPKPLLQRDPKPKSITHRYCTFPVQVPANHTDKRISNVSAFDPERVLIHRHKTRRSTNADWMFSLERHTLYFFSASPNGTISTKSSLKIAPSVSWLYV